MEIKAALTLCLAVLFPILSYAAIRSDVPPAWLGLVDFLLFSVILTATRLPACSGSRKAGRFWPVAAAISLCLTVFYLRPDMMIYFSPIGIGLISRASS